METIKLKILDEAGHTLMTCDADTAVSLVYTNCYKPGDRVALEIDHPGQYCVIQFEDTMPEALVYVVKREINFHIPFGEQAITYSPKSFVGSRHVIRARLALPEEIAARRRPATAPRVNRDLPCRQTLRCTLGSHTKRSSSHNNLPICQT